MSASLFTAAVWIDAPNETAAATRQLAPTTNIALVFGDTLPLFGSMQCFTLITESPSIAATSIAVGAVA